MNWHQNSKNQECGLKWQNTLFSITFEHLYFLQVLIWCALVPIRHTSVAPHLDKLERVQGGATKLIFGYRGTPMKPRQQDSPALICCLTVTILNEQLEFY